MISKIEIPNAVGDYRPIVLLNGSFKIMSKVLAYRLEWMIGQLVRDYHQDLSKGEVF